MPLFDIKINAANIPENSQEIARGIYDLLILHSDVTYVFTNYGYAWQHVTWVWNTAKNLEAAAIASIVANPTQTDVEWAGSVSVALLNKVQVLQDVIRSNPTPDNTRTFEQFVTAMTSGE